MRERERDTWVRSSKIFPYTLTSVTSDITLVLDTINKELKNINIDNIVLVYVGIH